MIAGGEIDVRNLCLAERVAFEKLGDCVEGVHVLFQQAIRNHCEDAYQRDGSIEEPEAQSCFKMFSDAYEVPLPLTETPKEEKIREAIKKDRESYSFLKSLVEGYKSWGGVGDTIPFLFLLGLLENNGTVYFISRHNLYRFEHELLLPLARQQRLYDLHLALNDFVAKLRKEKIPLKDHRLRSIVVLAGFLKISFAEQPGSRYGLAKVEEKMGALFYSNPEKRGEKNIYPGAKTGGNYYLLSLLQQHKGLALPNDRLLDFLYERGFRRMWIDELRKKLK